MKNAFTGMGVIAFGASTFYAGYLLARRGEAYKKDVEQGVRSKLRKMAEDVRGEVFLQARVDEKFANIVKDI